MARSTSSRSTTKVVATPLATASTNRTTTTLISEQAVELNTAATVESPIQPEASSSRVDALTPYFENFGPDPILGNHIENNNLEYLNDFINENQIDPTLGIDIRNEFVNNVMNSVDELQDLIMSQALGHTTGDYHMHTEEGDGYTRTTTVRPDGSVQGTETKNANGTSHYENDVVDQYKDKDGNIITKEEYDNLNKQEEKEEEPEKDESNDDNQSETEGNESEEPEGGEGDDITPESEARGRWYISEQIDELTGNLKEEMFVNSQFEIMDASIAFELEPMVHEQIGNSQANHSPTLNQVEELPMLTGIRTATEAIF
ncbi:hypothetical protein PMT_0328 [Prochlorococcus marinus str. MIT 9313]|uniref:Uncharacterized protein n=1 Tax=Prochlorococcus marinus (strain MIT 9313) TaxID=74547 RepID=Q7V8L3_PROMM|nr:hypothetical protein [Prochlorococcus marinus]CAE20503.1 hypothetical protein PMT_0328 [Prochlorococcus marinus str. MIT 9313]